MLKKTIVVPGDVTDSSEVLKKFVKKLTGVDFEPLESYYTNTVYKFSGYALESNDEFEENLGYSFEFLTKDVDNICDLELKEYRLVIHHHDKRYDKIVRTHDEIKSEMDSLWYYCEGDERFALRKLYSFMGEFPPCE